MLNQEFPETKDSTPWELLSKTTDVGECTLYRRPLGTSGLYEYYIKGYFTKITAETCYQVLCIDNEYRKQWDQYAIAIDTVDVVDGSSCVYWSCKFPWPLSNRDYLFYRKGIFDEETQTFLLVSKSGKHDKKPEFSNFVRVDNFASLMTIKQVDDKTEFRLWQQNDMKGNIPKTIVNWAISSGLPDYLKKIQEVCVKYPQVKLEEAKKTQS